MLKLKEISKTYRTGTFGSKELHAVINVSFDIQEGEVLSLIGESGSGKSTIGKMILGLISISSGEILFEDSDISQFSKSQLKEYYRYVQGVFQDPFSSYNPIFKADRVFKTVRDEFYPHVHMDEWNEKIKQALESVGLNPKEVLDKFPHQLSGGQLQRLLVARALLLDIKFLVADEIISMLDASTRIDVLNLLADLKSNGLSILFITHDLSLGYYLSQKSLILYRGCVMEMGSTEKIYNNPLHPYTWMLMASVPRLDEKWGKVDVELKEKQSEFANECVYYDRCTKSAKDASCKAGIPELIEVEPDHFVACRHI
jgi:peptide/nickel transport system ATP-binding protein